MIIIDDFCQDQALLDRIKRDDNFWLPGQFFWWDGWWNSPADTLKKQLIQYLWGERYPDPPMEIAGFEYWTAVSTVGKRLNTHRDKDENIFDSTGRTVVPEIGSVFYPIENNIDGGFLELYTRGKNEEPERIRPDQNRLVVFSSGEIYHGSTEVNMGIRRSFVVNLWKHPPSICNEEPLPS